jgi:hypothetical protein
MKTKLLIIAAIIACFSNVLKAQQSGMYPILAMDVQTTEIGGDTSENAQPALPDSILFNAHMHISLFDTTNIARLYVKIGRIPSEYDVLQTSFVFDAPNSAYVRNGNSIDLNLGDHSGIFTFYSELVIEKSDGTFTSPVLFNNR